MSAEGYGYLTKKQVKKLHKKMVCPYCNSPLLQGPTGGMAQNMFCSNHSACDAGFNVPPMPFSVEVIRPPISQRMYKSVLPPEGVLVALDEPADIPKFDTSQEEGRLRDLLKEMDRKLQ